MLWGRKPAFPSPFHVSTMTRLVFDSIGHLLLATYTSPNPKCRPLLNIRARRQQLRTKVCPQAGWKTHTYPEVMFRALNYTAKGRTCLPDKPPSSRNLDFNSASNLYADAEAVSPSPPPPPTILYVFGSTLYCKSAPNLYLYADAQTLRFLKPPVGFRV